MGSTSLKRLSELLSKSETSFKQLLKKLKLQLRPKRLRFFDSPLKCPSPNKTWNDDSPRKKKKSITLDETVSELSSLCRPVWTLNPNLELKPFDRRRSSKATSTTSKSSLDTPTDRPTKPPNKLRCFNPLSKTTSPNTTKLNDETKTSVNRWLLSSDDLTSSLEKSKSSETLSSKPSEAENSLRLSSTSPTSDLTCFTPRTPLSSIRNERSRPSSSKPRVKSKSPFLNAETLKKRPRNPLLTLL